MKIRLVGGPFGGQVKDVGSLAGQNTVRLVGPKKMTMRQRLEFRSSQAIYNAYQPDPMVTADYAIAMRVHNNGYDMVNLPCMHPDGTLFYEYVKDSKRDY
jgi:hypothetical protein